MAGKRPPSTRVKDKARDLGHKAADKPVELKNQAAKENKRHQQGRADKEVRVEPRARYRVPFIRLWRFQCFSSCFLFGLRAATGTRVLVFDPFRHRQLPKRSRSRPQPARQVQLTIPGGELAFPSARFRMCPSCFDGEWSADVR
jgi:hypothetical protein